MKKYYLILDEMGDHQGLYQLLDYYNLSNTKLDENDLRFILKENHHLYIKNLLNRIDFELINKFYDKLLKYRFLDENSKMLLNKLYK